MKRLTKDQRRALKVYNTALAQEDRYMGSVFANTYGQRNHKAKVHTAYESCKRLGMDHTHGL